MKKIVLLIGMMTVLTVAQTTAQNKMWKPLSQTPNRGGISHTATTLDGKIYVTTDDAVYRSKDKGMTWVEFPGKYSGNFTDLATYGSNTSGLFVGTDRSMSWTLNDGFQWIVRTFKVNDHSGLGGGVGRIHVDNSCGVLFSGNYMIQGSGSWTEIIPETTISDYLFDFPGWRLPLALAGDTQSGKIYQNVAGGSQADWEPISDMPSGYGRLFKVDETMIMAQLDKYESAAFTRLYMASADYGKTWTTINFKSTGLSNPTSTVSIHAIHDGKIYASEYNMTNGFYGTTGLYVSTDNMQSWQLLHPELAGAHVNEIDFMHFQKEPTGDIVIVTNDRGVLYFDAAANSLSERNNGLISRNPQTLFFTNSSMFALDWTGLVSSSNNGSTWNQVLVNGEKVQPQTMAVMPNGEIFLGTLATKASGKSMLLKSTDGGATWSDSDNGIMPAGEDAWARIDEIQYDNAGNIYASMFQNSKNSLYVSKNGAQSWSEMSLSGFGAGFAMWDAAVKPTGEIIVLGSDNPVMTPAFFTSADGGATWTTMPISETLQTTLFTTMTLDRNGTLYMPNAVGEMFKNTGDSWQRITTAEQYSKFYFDRNNNIYQIPTGGTASWQGVKFSADGGMTWEVITNGLPQNAEDYTISGVAFDLNNTPYVSLSDGITFRLEQPSSVEEGALESTLSVMPNPVMDHVTIAFKSDSPAQITLYSILGDVVYSGTISGSITIDTKDLAPGVYHCRISGENIFKTGHIVKK